MSKRILIWGSTVLVLVGFVAGLAYLAKQDAAKKPSDTGSPTRAADVTASDWTKGPADARVTLIEYSDLQCPACGFFYPIVKQVSTEYGDRVRFAYRHFPLRQIHKNAELAARATEAAGKQGKFWEMHDLLFEKQSSWAQELAPTLLFMNYATSIGLDGEKFLSDFVLPEVRANVESDYQSGLDAKVEGTPTFFLNGFRISNPQSYDEFKSVIERALAPQS
ncbi:MAG: thioredoxin domain-containing protein [bacterium]|nr:thioredoxin domain-containing protein [bacterium]